MRFTYGPVEIEIGESTSGKGRSLEERVEIAECVAGEARETLQEQIDTLSIIDEKAGKMMRVNILFLGIILSGFSLLIEREIIRDKATIFNSYSIIGLGLLVLSISIAALAYTASNTIGGIKAEAIGEIFEEEYSEVQVKEGIASSYEDWITNTRPSIIRNALRITVSAVALTWGLTFLSLGIIHAVSFPISQQYVLISVAMLSIYTIFSGVYGHLKRWYFITEPITRIRTQIARPKNYILAKLF